MDTTKYMNDIKYKIKVTGLEGRRTFPQLKCNVCNTIIKPIDYCWMLAKEDNTSYIKSMYVCSKECIEMATFQLL